MTENTVKRRGRKPKVRTEEPTVNDTQPVNEESTQDEVEVSGAAPQIIVGSVKNYGISMDRYSVSVWHRPYYAERTEVDAGPRWGTRVFEAGDYGKWKLAPRPYQKDISNALNWISEMMLQEKLEGASEIQVLADLVLDVKDEIRDIVKELKAQNVAARP